MNRRASLPRPTLAMALAVVAVLAGTVAAPAVAADCGRTSVGLTPLDDLGAGTYQGAPGGLYPEGSNEIPAGHRSDGMTLAEGIVPRDREGAEDPSGRYVLLSIGMSNTSQEFRALTSASSPEERDAQLALLNGAQNGADAQTWADPTSSPWQTLEMRLAKAGLSPSQVAVVWLKVANATPSQGWPDETERLRSDMESILRNLTDRFPNLALTYVSSRIYAGYATGTLNPEPYAYESGFAAKWLIEDQLEGSPALNFDPTRGPVEAPWAAWGPYLWADGLHARSDGLTWSCSDFGDDGIHPSRSGAEKVAGLLLDFFTTDPTARAWFVEDGPEEDSVDTPPPTNGHTLTADRTGDGAGMVASSPDGIRCGSDCAEDYAAGTPVTLTARAASGSTFAGWSGGCSGTASTCTLTMEEARSATASFVRS